MSGFSSWHISSSVRLEDTSGEEEVNVVWKAWAQVWVQRENGVSIYRNQAKKKFHAAGLTPKLLVTAMTWIHMFTWKKATIYHTWSDSKAGEGQGSLFWGEFCSKNFFFRVRRKEKTPNPYAEIINVYANEPLTKKTRKIKGTKWILMDMCFKHANRQHTTRDKHWKQITVLWSNSGYMWVHPLPCPAHPHVASLSWLVQSALVAEHTWDTQIRRWTQMQRDN